MRARAGGGYGLEELSKKEKGLTDIDNSVVIPEGDIRGLNGNGKNNTIKVKQQIIIHMYLSYG